MINALLDGSGVLQHEIISSGLITLEKLSPFASRQPRLLEIQVILHLSCAVAQASVRTSLDWGGFEAVATFGGRTLAGTGSARTVDMRTVIGRIYLSSS